MQVVEGHLRRRPHHREDPRTVEREPCQHALVGLEAVEVVLLLEARVPADFPRTRAQPVEPALRDRLGDDDTGRRRTAESVLLERKLVVEGVRRADAQRTRRQRQLVRGVRQRDVEPPLAGESAERTKAFAHRADLREPGRPAVWRSDDGVLEPRVVEQLERLGEVARADRHLVAPASHQLD